MPLIKCPECQNEISDKAAMCVHCGFPIKEHLEKSIEKKDKEITEDDNAKERYWCRNCYRQNEVGEDYCAYCGSRLTPCYAPINSILSNWHKEEKISKTDDEKKEIEETKKSSEFHGIYRYTLFGSKQEVYCPRCGSENCSYYQEQHIIPGKTKTRYTANLNPLLPFTLINKKEKVIRRERVVTESKIICNSCGNMF